MPKAMSSRPSLVEIEEFLIQNQALIVHFSGTPKGVGPGEHLFPDDLLHVLAGNAGGGLSCSVVTPRDSFHGGTRHATGTVGLIICPRLPASLIGVSPGDAGSCVCADGSRWVPDADIDVAALMRSLTDRVASYNEWVVRDFEVRGVFVAKNPMVTKLVRPHVQPEAASLINVVAGIPCIESVSVEEIAQALPGQHVYSFEQGQLVEWGAGSWAAANHPDLVRL